MTLLAIYLGLGTLFALACVLTTPSLRICMPETLLLGLLWPVALGAWVKDGCP